MKLYIKSNYNSLLHDISRKTESYRKSYPHISLKDDYLTVIDNIATSNKTGIQYKIEVGSYRNGNPWAYIYRISDGHQIKLGYANYPTLDLKGNTSYGDVDQYIADYEAGSKSSYNTEFKEDELLLDLLSKIDVNQLDDESKQKFDFYYKYLSSNRDYIGDFISFLKSIV